jgi:acetyl esterase/lipase
LDAAESSEHAAIAKTIANDTEIPPSEKRRQLILLMRKQSNERGESTKIDSEVRPVDVDGVRAEWVIAPNVIPGHRLLYIHGGAYVMGSPKSHRPIASRFSEATKAAVLSIDYRLMPESKRIDGVEDCRNAYQWIMENGPDGPSQVRKLIVAGDSSGGNMVLSIIAWARDQGLRAAGLESPSAIAKLVRIGLSNLLICSSIRSVRMVEAKMRFRNWLMKLKN